MDISEKKSKFIKPRHFQNTLPNLSFSSDYDAFMTKYDVYKKSAPKKYRQGNYSSKTDFKSYFAFSPVFSKQHFGHKAF